MASHAHTSPALEQWCLSQLHDTREEALSIPELIRRHGEYLGSVRRGNLSHALQGLVEKRLVFRMWRDDGMEIKTVYWRTQAGDVIRELAS